MSGNSDAYYEELAEQARRGKNIKSSDKTTAPDQIKELQRQIKVLVEKCSQGEK